MSRTIRRDRRKQCLVPDGKQSYQCRCAWCMSLDKQKELDKLAWTSDISIPDKIEAEEHYYNNMYEYYEDYAWIGYYDYSQHESFIG